MAILDLGKVKLTYKGSWATATDYEKDDVVVHNGSIWICTRDHAASDGSEGSYRLAPGKRHKSQAYGAQYQENSVSEIYNVRKTAGKFYLNGRKNPDLTFYKTKTYRFYVYDSTMNSVNFRFSETTDGSTYSTGVTVSGTPGTPGAYVELTVDLNTPATLTYKQDGASGVADTNTCTISPIWQGDMYWEEMARGVTFKSKWNVSTQYYRNDIVAFDGNMYLALADNLGEYPNIVSRHIDPTIEWWRSQPNRTNNHIWHLLSGNQWARRNSTTAWLYNQGPINWPYKNGDTQNPAIYRGRQWYISSDGRLWTLGGSSTGGHVGAYNTSGRTTYWNEVPFEAYDYWTNEINDRTDMDIWGSSFNPGPYLEERGWSKFYNRTGERPKVIQIDTGYDWSYFVLDNGEVWHCGEDQYGAGGHGTLDSEPGFLLKVLGLQDTKIIKVITSKSNEDTVHHVLALSEDGDVYSWGYNGYGQLGLGHNYNQTVPRKIPREFFGGEEIVDIYATGTTNGASYARTKSDYLYAWGRNNCGQLGVGDTADRWRPEKIVSWDPTTNGGIVKFCPTGWSTNCFINLLDGNGYIWHAGDNAYGTAVNGSTTDNTTLARSTVSPTAGNVVDFWNSSPSGYGMLWMRTASGSTYFCGTNTGYYGGTGTSSGNSTNPTLVQRVNNCVRAFSVATANTNIRSYWLTESGELWTIAYGTSGPANPYVTGGSTIEDGSTYFPYRAFIPLGTKLVDMMASCGDESTNYYGPNNHAIADNGQIFSWGRNVGNGLISGQINGDNATVMVAGRKSFN